jgi:hypothetical protein
MSSVGALEEVCGIAAEAWNNFSVVDDSKDRKNFPIFLQSDSLQLFLKQFKMKR